MMRTLLPMAAVTLAGAMLSGDSASARTNCGGSAYIVFFDADDAAITAKAADVLNKVVAIYGNCEGFGIVLTGHTDRKGKRAANQKLSQKMVNNVRAYLVMRGVAADRLTGTAYGEDRLLVPTADGVREPQNRRVEILFGPATGS